MLYHLYLIKDYLKYKDSGEMRGVGYGMELLKGLVVILGRRRMSFLAGFRRVIQLRQNQSQKGHMVLEYHLKSHLLCVSTSS